MDEQDLRSEIRSDMRSERNRLNRQESAAWGGTVLLGVLWLVVGVLPVSCVLPSPKSQL